MKKSLEMMSLSHKKYKVSVASLGCPKNLCDTENMLALLMEAGHEIINEPSEAEVIIVNTCAFIGDAKEESINTILDLADFKLNGALKYLIVSGCLAERYNKEIKEEIKEVDAVVGTGDFHRINEVLSMLENKEDVCLYGNASSSVMENLPRVLTGAGHFAYLKISEGCDNKCTYCIIPRLRGKYRSRKMEDILSEARELAGGGVKEIILIAQDTSVYGKDLENASLSDLIKELEKIDGIEWIRLHYCYPEGIDDKLISAIKNSKKVVKYLDMPIQHISDSVLKRMGRKSSESEICELILKLRKEIPDITIRTSLIVGFPGETEEDFSKLCEFLDEFKLDRVGVFAFSREEDTAAYKLSGQIDEEVKNKRRDILMEKCMIVSQEKNKKMIGKEIVCICDGFDEENFLYRGRSEKDSPDIDSCVYFGAEREVSPGEILKVLILDADEYDLYGKEVKL